MTGRAGGPRVSVVLNTYNRAGLVSRAIESVLVQTWDDFELLVVDDGSTDDTQAVVTSHRDTRIRYVHRENGGLAVARNTGLDAAEGELLAFLDDDDLVQPTWLARLVTTLDREQAGVVTCGTEIRSPAGTSMRLPSRLGPAWDEQTGLFLSGTFLVRTDVLREVGGYAEALRCSEQTELSLRLVAHCMDRGLRVASVSEPLVIVNRAADDARPLRRPDYLHSGSLLVLERHEDKLRRSPALYANFKAIAAVQGARLGRYAEARRLLVDAIRADPRNPRHYLRLVAAAVPALGRRAWGVWPGVDHVAAPAFRRLRVTYVLDSLGQGGAETSLLQIIAALGDRIEADLVVLRDRPDLKPEADRQGLRVILIASGGGPPMAAIRLLMYLRRRQPDLVHTTLFQANVVGRIAGLLARTPVVSSLVSTPYGTTHRAEPGLSAVRVRAAQAVDAVTCRLVRRFHANAEHVATTMARRLAIERDRIDVINRGRDASALGSRTDDRSRRAREALGLDGRPVIVAIGREEHLKGLDVLISALTMCTNSVDVIIAGRSGNATSDLRSRASLLPHGARIRFLGFREDVPELLAAADILALPSRREGFPGVLLEAMALETPIVATDLPGVREVIGDDIGWLVPVDDAAALAVAIDAVLNDPDEAARRTRRGRERFVREFSIEHTADEMLGFYRRALALDAEGSSR
jgi:glycosyltransferase involved in cell wall biosynthesis